jgi:hypothetical protein
MRPRAGAWGRPVTVSDPGAGAFAGAPEVALDGRGAAVAVWQQNGKGRGHGGRRVGTVGEPLDLPVRGAGGSPAEWWCVGQAGQVVRAGGQDAGRARVAVEGQGNATAVWTWSPRVQTARWPTGGAWRRPVTLSPDGSAGGPQVAADGQGNATAVWERSDGTSYAVQAARRPAEGS